jgi:hypothetical protein
MILGCLGIADPLALHNNLRTDFALRLQQYRVHMHAGGNTGGPGLQSLRPANLAAIRRHRGIVGHILRLERHDPHAPVRQQPRQPSHQQGFANIRSGALKHQREGHAGALMSVVSPPGNRMNSINHHSRIPGQVKPKA